MTHDQTNDTLPEITPIKTNSSTPPKRHSSHYKKKKTSGIDWPNEPYNHARGESALWTAVITQAMMDALNRSRNAEAAYHKHEAICWLTGNSKDFVLVCLLAGFDPDYIRRKAKRALVSPVSWRAAAGEGSRYIERKAYRQRQKKTARPKEIRPSPQPEGERVIVGRWS